MASANEMMPLFVTDRELAALLGGPKAGLEWRVRIAILEKRGLPPVDGALGVRYFPAVRQFLDTYYGVGIAAAPCTDGQETGWAARKRKGMANG